MSFPGVVKPYPWPGLQSHPSMAGPLWPHHHHHSAQASPNGISEKISATTQIKVLPQARYGQVTVKRDRDADSPPPPPVSQPLFDESLPRPAPVSTLLPPSSSTVVRIGDNEESSAGLKEGSTQQLSPTDSEASKKLKRVRRKRCGTCTGCTRKDNCGTCCVCTNPNATNSVCKLKRCELLKQRRVSCSTNPPLFEMLNFVVCLFTCS